MHLALAGTHFNHHQNYRYGSCAQVCSETLIGNEVIRGVSGGQRKRVTTGDQYLMHVQTYTLTFMSCI